MTVPTTKQELSWLWERLFLAKRDMESHGVSSPSFVLVTKNAEERRLVEARIIKHFEETYGMNLVINARTMPVFTNFYLSCGMHVFLIDLE